MFSMSLTSHDLRILRLASEDPEGRLPFHIARDGSIALQGAGGAPPLPAGEGLPKLEDGGFLTREVERSYRLTPRGWRALREGPGQG
jgi:hypothetical protein